MLQKSSDGCALTKTTHVFPKCTIDSVYLTCVANVYFIRDILTFLMLTSVQKSEHFTIRFKSYITANAIKALRLKTVKIVFILSLDLKGIFHPFWCENYKMLSRSSGLF